MRRGPKMSQDVHSPILEDIDKLSNKLVVDPKVSQIGSKE